METASLIAQIVLAFLYGLGIWLAYKNTNRQSRNNFFAEYTKRYHDIILAMPDEVFEGTAEPKGKTLKYMQLYFDLCSEEYHLYEIRLIPKDVWENWVEGMVVTANNDLYRRAWNLLKGNYNKQFFLFMEGDVLKIRNEKRNTI